MQTLTTNVHLYPFDKYIEKIEENKNLYEALLKEKGEKIALLERMLERK